MRIFFSHFVYEFSLFRCLSGIDTDAIYELPMQKDNRFTISYSTYGVMDPETGKLIYEITVTDTPFMMGDTIRHKASVLGQPTTQDIEWAIHVRFDERLERI